MKLAIVGSLTALLAGAGLALADPPAELLHPPRSLGAVGSDQPATAPLPAMPAGPAIELGDGTSPIPAPSCGLDGVPYRYWLEGDYLLWWLKEDHFPTLLTAGTAASQGILGVNGTVPLVGGNDLDNSQRSGGRVTFGGWITDYQGFGLEGSFFMLESSSKTFNAAGTGTGGSPVLAVPFFNVLSGREAAFPIAFPGLESGSVTSATEGVQCDAGRLFGGEFHFVANFCCSPECRFDFLVGYRYLSLDDRFGMTENSAIVATIPTIGGTTTSISDRFDTGNQFNGGQIGLRGEYHYDRFSVRGTATVAFGATNEGVTIDGVTTLVAPGHVPLTLGGGLFALPSNSGSFHSTDFAAVPEVGLTLGYQACDWLRFTLGYSFLYWSSVVRSGDQINSSINPLQVPAIGGALNSTAAVPGISTLHCTDFWAEGVSAGIELRW